MVLFQTKSTLMVCQTMYLNDYQTLLKGGKFVKDPPRRLRLSVSQHNVYDADKSKEENLEAFEEFKKQAIKDVAT